MKEKRMKTIQLKLLLIGTLSIFMISTDQLSAREKTICSCVQIRTFAEHWSICRKLYNVVVSILPEGSTMLELGSGWASGEFSKKYTVYSIEHDKQWLDKYTTNYIYAPLVDGWYSREHLVKSIPKDYGLILVDGPPGEIGRGKFFDNLDLFNTDVPILFDDVNRDAEYDLMMRVSKFLNREVKIFICGEKKFGVLLANE